MAASFSSFSFEGNDVRVVHIHTSSKQHGPNDLDRKDSLEDGSAVLDMQTFQDTWYGRFLWYRSTDREPFGDWDIHPWHKTRPPPWRAPHYRRGIDQLFPLVGLPQKITVTLQEHPGIRTLVRRFGSFAFSPPLGKGGRTEKYSRLYVLRLHFYDLKS